MVPTGKAVITQACLNQAQAQSFPANPPSVKQKCAPPRKLALGVFFDGTGNNMYRDWKGSPGAGCETNVARLYRVYREKDDADTLSEKIYVVGVGAMSSQSGVSLAAEMKSEKEAFLAAVVASAELQRSVPCFGDVTGLATGSGGRERLIIAYRWARAWCKSMPAAEQKVVDVYGFSRGAALARTFVNLVNMGLKKEVPNLSVRFLGVFDTVGSFGMTGDDVDVGQNMGIAPGDAAAVRHFTARHEIRKNFPLTALSSADREYVGAHSDVGGGYEAKEGKTTNHLAFVALKDMHQESIDNGVELGPLTFPPGVDVEQIRAASQKYWPAYEVVAAKGGSFEIGRDYFYQRYIHTSHDPDSLSNKPEPGGRRRVFPNPAKKPFRKYPPNYEWVE